LIWPHVGVAGFQGPRSRYLQRGPCWAWRKGRGWSSTNNPQGARAREAVDPRAGSALPHAPALRAPGARVGRATAAEEPRAHRPRPRPYHGLIDTWLVADREAPRKQRHTPGGCGSAWSRSRAPGWASPPCGITYARPRSAWPLTGGGDRPPAPRARGRGRGRLRVDQRLPVRRAHRGGAVHAHVGLGKAFRHAYGNEARKCSGTVTCRPSRSSAACPGASATTT